MFLISISQNRLFLLKFHQHWPEKSKLNYNFVPETDVVISYNNSIRIYHSNSPNQFWVVSIGAVVYESLFMFAIRNTNLKEWPLIRCVDVVIYTSFLSQVVRMPVTGRVTKIIFFSIRFQDTVNVIPSIINLL